MRKFALVAGFITAGLWTVPAFADFKIAVVDPDAVLAGSNAFKKANEQLGIQIKPKEDRLKQLKDDMDKLEEKFTKDKSIMSDKDQGALRAQAERDVQEFQQTKNDLEKAAGEQRQALLQKMVPKMKAAIEELRKAGGYALVINKGSVVGLDQSLDITAKVTDKVNAMGDK